MTIKPSGPLYRVVSIAGSRTHWSDGGKTLCGFVHFQYPRAVKTYPAGTAVSCHKCRKSMERQ